MMALKEPKRKRRGRLRPRKQFPIDIGSENEWTRYTGYLGNLGVCVIEPYEIEALHFSGFFGKGSLSRSFPNFEKTRGKPPIVRRRQLLKRQEWFGQASKLDAEAFSSDLETHEWLNIGNLNPEEGTDNVAKDRDIKTNTNEFENDESILKSIVQDLINRIVSTEQRVASPTLKVNEQSENNAGINKPEKNHLNHEVFGMSLPESQNVNEISMQVLAKVDEVVLDSTEEDEICEISNTKTTQSVAICENLSGDTDIVLLNDEEISPVDLNKVDYSMTESLKEINNRKLMRKEERKLVVLSDSDSDIENDLTNIRPTIEKEKFQIRETMYLTFEEAFFLMFGLGCLQIVDLDGNLLNILDAWKYFCGTRNDFVQKYVVYHYFRSKGWVVKPGLKYGGDFLLYKQGPPFYHASYIVIVEVSDADTLIRDEKKTGRKMTWKKLFGLDRLSETAAKEILFAEVLWPSKIPLNEIPSSPELLAEFTVRELLYRRWIPKQTREDIDLENFDNYYDDNDNKS